MENEKAQMDTKDFFNTKAAWSGYEYIRGNKRKVQYLDNVARVGDKVIDNRHRQCFRECSVELSEHFRTDKSSTRRITGQEAATAVGYGIEVRSDRYIKGTHQERYQYLYDGLLVAARKKNDKEIEVLSAYSIQPAFRLDFLGNMCYLKEEMLAAGAYGFDAVVVDLNMWTSQKLFKEGNPDDTIVWRVGDDPIDADSLRQYSMTITVTNKEKINLEQLNILKRWGLNTADVVNTEKYKDGERHLITYNMARFSGNAHEWARERT